MPTTRTCASPGFLRHRRAHGVGFLHDPSRRHCGRFFQGHFNLTVAQFAYLPTVIVFCGSVPQPFMGYFSDGRDRMVLVALGLFVTGVFVSCIGFSPSAYILAVF